LRLRAIARSLRHAATDSEEALWRELSSRKLGVSFRRQVVLGGSIVDFYASSVHLVVEVDGTYHEGHGAADARRDRALARRGCRVLRIPAEVVLHNLPEAVARIRAALQR
jgi:leucyl-tRNA synthetase/ATP-dependent DNA helicase RecG/methylmalonyl-CoA mutase